MASTTPIRTIREYAAAPDYMDYCNKEIDGLMPAGGRGDQESASRSLGNRPQLTQDAVAPMIYLPARRHLLAARGEEHDIMVNSIFTSGAWRSLARSVGGGSRGPAVTLTVFHWYQIFIGTSTNGAS